MKVFGRSGAEILPLIDEFKELSEQARRFKFVRTPAEIKALDDFGDALSLQRGAMQSLGDALAQGVLPGLNSLVAIATRAALAARDFARAHQLAIRSIFAFGSVAAVAGSCRCASSSVGSTAKPAACSTTSRRRKGGCLDRVPSPRRRGARALSRRPHERGAGSPVAHRGRPASCGRGSLLALRRPRPDH